MYKVAIASSNGRNIDLHFGQAKEFHIIQVDEKTGRWEESELRKIPDFKLCEPDFHCRGHGGDTASLKTIAGLLQDCPYLLVKKIGLYPYRILQQSGTDSLEAPCELDEAIRKLNAYHTRRREKGRDK
ncbi:hypothetical protein EQM14_11925 [Caproiciproducens sp. NJN-50]|uniref:NifB/NifX family molybdenum-iron cluster-binding protein n=1 Tax=Acutalibacteraceae TaxID=3082771 RepID=UPI000FFE2EAD|nr:MULTISPECIES: NifB/NifX family molybdenum-iron cluster-binding protein [Acutalibacteraceae]QAT50412.1 hypothetical protein EQM14_11925 [Caproiciproducens sp. NJN-50]